MYGNVRKIFGAYWSAYGGWKALWRSPYLHATLAVLALTFHSWIAPICDDKSCVGWWDQSLSVLPNLLGFTLSGFAIFVGFGDDKFRSQLAYSRSPKATPFEQFAAMFVHFVVIQVIALVVAIVAKSWWFYASWMDDVRQFLPYLNAFFGAVGYGFFLYAIACALATTMHVFRIARMYVFFKRQIPKKRHVSLRQRLRQRQIENRQP